MNGYKDYMDNVEVSEALHERLTGLTAPAKAPMWKKYGAAAAALVLALGVGAFGLSRALTWRAPQGSVDPGAQPSAGQTPAIAPVPAGPQQAETDTIDLAPEPAPEPMPLTPGMQTMGGYEIVREGIASYYLLPYIAYGEYSGVSAGHSLAEPDGGLREATREDFLALLGCDEGALSDHLDWGGYELSGTVGFDGDGSVHLLLLYGTSDSGEFHLEVMPGRLPIQDCIVIGQEVTTTDVWGVEVAGTRNVGMIGSGERGIYLDKSLQTEFIAHDVGVRCTMYGTDYDELERLMSRFVRWAVLEGLHPERITRDGEWITEPAAEPDAAASFAPELPIPTPEIAPFEPAERTDANGSYALPSMTPTGPVPTPETGDFDPMTEPIPDRGTPPWPAPEP